MTDRLTDEHVRHVARLARLSIDEDRIEQHREELSSILEHLARVGQVDVSEAEPMAHPGDFTNRLAEDEIAASMPVERLLAVAPAVEDRFLAVPKVLGDES
ncbi:MAG: Asp-tRNA(Asn)/Glu-tRNA(Gln) amidotransferase subunit GatC [Planctomycetota bacterium]|jgi:aspartyl-tRNA(Asn)/glutamyl-tRNA(Gln) amidotransferase subunit C